MPSTTTGSSGPRRQTRVSTPYSRRRRTRRTRPPTPASRARIAAYSPPPSQASALELKPSPKKQACRGCMREFTIDSTWRQDSRWVAGLPPSRLRRTSTRSPPAPTKRRRGEGKARWVEGHLPRPCCVETAPSLVDLDRPRHPSVNRTVVGIRAGRRVCMEEDLSDRQARIERATVVGHRVGHRTAILPTHRLPMINGRDVG